MTAMSTASEVRVIVASDFDGYFEGKVRDALSRIDSCPYRVVRISATPYLADAVQYEPRGDEISLKFYSGLRRGYGRIDWSDVLRILSTRHSTSQG